MTPLALAQTPARAATNERLLPVALLVEGDAPTRAMLRFLLEGDGYRVVETMDVSAASPLPRGAEVALVALIAAEREGQALGALGALRCAWPGAPMILFSRDVSLTLRRGAFALGVQDILPLPVGARDLQARLRAVPGPRVARHAGFPGDEAVPVGGETVRAGGLLLTCATREVADGSGWSACLTRREAALLKALMAAPGQVVGHQELVERVWGANRDGVGSANALAVYVRRLRAKLYRPERPREYVRTAHGQGYTFDARSMPRADDRRADGSDAEESEGCRGILVVDDDRATLEMTAEVLRTAGYAVTCGVGPQAPTLARQTLPRVILLDINMPGMNGVEVRQHLRESPRTAAIPVIALSAGGNLRLRAGEMGADDYLAKPFSTDELLLRVEKWAGSAR